MVCGLGPGERVTLRLRPILANNKYGDPVLTFTMGNGYWEHAGVPSGNYRLAAVTEGTDFVTVPGGYGIFAGYDVFRFHIDALGIPRDAVTWRFSGLSFEVVRRDRAVERFGTPLCDYPPLGYPGHFLEPTRPPLTLTPLPPPGVTPQGTITLPWPPVPPLPPKTPVPQCIASHFQQVEYSPPLMSGALKGLKADARAMVAVYSLPKVQGRCYFLYEETSACTKPPGPEPADAFSDSPSSDLVASFSAGSPGWALAGEALQTQNRYLVVVRAAGYKVSPSAYTVDLPALHLAPTWLRGIDFTFVASP